MQTRPRRYHHGDLRAALLTRAEETLAEKGPGALSLRELARDLGVSHAAPSRHFKDKQALLDALALAGFERLLATLTASQDTAGESFADRLGALARTYVGFATANAELLDLMFAVKHDPELAEEA
ncbi:TetR/AcrR family transcriptional regulator, partial [Streptomyces sp. NPDC127044]